jgi:hypothetical protein
MIFVALESIADIVCPLTAWENALRGNADAQSFVGRWVSRLLYYDLPEWLFTAVYVAFALAVLAAWFIVPPARQGGHSPISSGS